MSAPAKTVGVALIEQLGSLVAIGIYLVVLQHLMVTTVMSKPEQSWINRLRAWWLDEQLRAEKRRFRPWMSKEVAEEPTPAED